MTYIACCVFVQFLHISPYREVLCNVQDSDIGLLQHDVACIAPLHYVLDYECRKAVEILRCYVAVYSCGTVHENDAHVCSKWLVIGSGAAGGNVTGVRSQGPFDHRRKSMRFRRINSIVRRHLVASPSATGVLIYHFCGLAAPNHPIWRSTTRPALSL
jgi:hypothetical protein